MMALVHQQARPASAWWGGVAVVLSLLAITALLYLVGGTQTGLPHLYYLPICASALLYRAWGGALAGAAAGLLCGPFMPLSLMPGTAQAPATWLMRLIMFIALGTLVGLIVTALRQRTDEVDRLNQEVINSFIRTIDAKCQHTARHSQMVARYAVMIARTLGLPAHQVEQVRWAALLHDIGKLRVPDAILAKPGALSPDEWSIIRKHPIESVHVLDGIEAFRHLLPAIRHHHERWDGRGYPDGIAGPAIPLEARVLAVADAYDAMTSARPYRPALSRAEALQELQAGSGHQFDAEIITAFQSALLSADEAVA